MNTICQDRTRTSAALSYVRIDPHQPANTLNGYPLATAGIGPQEYAGTRKSLRKQVGKSFANWTPLFANWIQLADPCQLHSYINQPLTQHAEWFFYAHFNHTPITHFLTKIFVGHMLVP